MSSVLTRAPTHPRGVYILYIVSTARFGLSSFKFYRIDSVVWRLLNRISPPSLIYYTCMYDLQAAAV